MLGWLYQRWQKKRSIIATVACNASDVSEPNKSHTTIDSILASPRRVGVAESSLARASLIEGSLLAICIEYIACRLYDYDAADLCAIPGDLLALILDKRAWAGQSDSGIVNTRSISHLLHGIEDKGEICLDLDTVILAAPPRRSFSASSADNQAAEKDNKLMASLLTKVPRARNIEATGFLFSDAPLLSMASVLRGSIRTLNLSYCPLITDLSLAILVTLPSLSSLNLKGCQGIVGAGFKSMHGHGLQKLILSSCGSLECGVKQGISNLPSLEHLDLSYCINLPDDELESISGLWLNGNKGLSHLALCSTSVSSMTLRNILRVAGHWLGSSRSVKPLIHLDIKSCNISHSAFSLPDLGSSPDDHTGHLPRLEFLDLSGCPRVKDEGLFHLASLVKEGTLKHLNLSRTSISDTGLLYFSDRVSSVERLELDSCSRVGDRGVAAMLRSCPRIKHLDLSETMIGDSTLALIHHLTLPNPPSLLWHNRADPTNHLLALTHLNLSWTRLTNQGIASSLSALTTLSHLNMDSGSLTDHALASLPPSLTSLSCFSLKCHDSPGAAFVSKALSLQSLELCGGFLGDAGLIELANLTNLTSLNLSQNPRITDKGIVSLLSVSSPTEQLNSLDNDSSASSGISSSSSSSSGSDDTKIRSKGLKGLRVLTLAGCTRVSLGKTNPHGQQARNLVLDLEHLTSLCLSNNASREIISSLSHEMKLAASEAKLPRPQCIVKFQD